MNKIITLLWKNSETYYDEYWGPTFWGWVVLAIVIGLITFLLLVNWYKKSEEHDKEVEKRIRLLGYKDILDIEVFLDRIDASIEDFITSKGIRKQYELFTEGKSSDFIKTAEGNKKADEAEAPGQATGFTTGLIIGQAMNQSLRGRRQ